MGCKLSNWISEKVGEIFLFLVECDWVCPHWNTFIFIFRESPLFRLFVPVCVLLGHNMHFYLLRILVEHLLYEPIVISIVTF
jgi:hypothetical protein